MFTGIVEALGVVESIQRIELNQAPVVRLVIVTDLPVEALPLGASIAVDGVCLTIVARAKGDPDALVTPMRRSSSKIAARCGARRRPSSPKRSRIGSHRSIAATPTMQMRAPSISTCSSRSWHRDRFTSPAPARTGR